MAALGEPVPLCTCFHEKDLLSVEINNSTNEVLVSCKTKSIYIFKLDDQKAVQSWSIRKGQTISSPVRSNFVVDGKEFITVVNHQDIRTWNKDEIHFEKSDRIHCKFKIHEVLTSNNWKPVVVCENGAVDFLNEIQQSHKSMPEIDGCILACGIACVLKSICVVCMTQQQNGNLVVNHHWYHKKSKIWRRHSSQYNCPDGEHYVHSQVYTVGSAVKLTILFSNGELHTMNLTDQSDKVTDHTTLTISGVHCHTSMVVLDPVHVAVGVLKNKEEGIGIFDLQFGTLQTWRALRTPAQSKLQLFYQHGNLLVPCGNTLLMYAVTCQPSTLASILGQVGESSNKPQAPYGHYQWSASTHTVKGIHDEDTMDLFDLLCDKEKTKTLNSFKTQFSLLMKKLKAEDDQSWLNGSAKMTTLTQRCVSEERFWPREQIEILIKQQAFLPSILPNLVDVLIKHTETVLLHITVKTAPELPETCICKILQYYLSCETETLIKAADSLGVSGTLEDPHWAFQFFVNGVLSLSYNDVFLVECLRTVKFHHVLVLLKYLHYLLGERTQDEYTASQTNDSTHTVDIVPPLLQIVEWMCMLLDAHVTQLVISPDARLLLLTLHSLVQIQVQFYDDLVSLDAFLQQLLAKSALPKKHSVGHYCMEVLHVL